MAFGKTVRTFRMDQEIDQEALVAQAAIERSHMGRIERGEHMPSLAVIL
ncbi:helix-turn-helix domain-containing protein [Xanthomonas campestris pv. clerodendri]|nr:helix-turn-helix domain-containing protein [Xanthomonas campestris pv. clerodendri]